MLSGLFKSTPVIDQSSKAWIFDSFVWCVENLDSEYFAQQSQLILPSNDFYPGSVDSVEKMAEKIFSNTIDYAGLSAWPLKLVSSEIIAQQGMTQLQFADRLRGKQCTITNSDSVSEIQINYHPSQINQPQDFIAYFVQILSGILLSQRGLTAPGGQEMLAQTIDLVACFMGFGVIFSNTAYQFKGGCGSCNIQSLNRQAALPELETVYALALFAVVKGSDKKAIKKSLKKHLYSAFKKSCKDIERYLEQGSNQAHKRLLTIS